MDHKIILKCRLCLDEFDEERMHDLFKESPEFLPEDNDLIDDDQEMLKLSEKVEYCCGVRIRDSIEMPSKICMKCNEMTKIWFNFRQMCINSQVYLESLCKDNPTLIGDSAKNDDYWEYVVEDLQTFRAKARKTNSAFTIKIDSLKEEIEDDLEDELKGELDEDTEAAIEVELDGEFLDTIDEIDSDADVKPPLKTEARPKRQLPSKKATTAVPAATIEPCDKPTTRGRPPQKRTSSAANNGIITKRQCRPDSPTSYMCSICGNVYHKKNSFKYHMTLHSNVKPHECELCGKNFRHVTELNSHMRRHTGEKPYKCSHCDRRFVDRSERHRHERVHTNTRPYECHLCGKRFTYSAILKNHLKYHSGVKDFNCLVCDKSFTLHHQLKAHLQTITHKQKEEQFAASGYEVVYQ